MGKSFTPKADEYDPVVFDIAGTEFICEPDVPGTALLEYSEGMKSRNDGVQSEAIFRFFKVAMSEEVYKDFRTFIDDKKNHVDVDLIITIVQFLVAEYGRDRPTKRSGSSTPGPSTTGTSSKVA